MLSSAVRPRYHTFDPLLGAEAAAGMVQLCERVGSYPVVANGMSRPIDGSKRYARPEPGRGERFSSRSQYFRERYAWGGEVLAPGLEPLFRNERMLEAAGELYGCSVVEPRVTYANLLLPGHELALHTDVPRFRGVHRDQNPLWLLVVMHHSGLFERWRVRVATCTSWYQDCEGGEAIFYPDGPDGERVTLEARFDTALLFDADSVFHGVRTVRGDAPPAPDATGDMHLRFVGDGRWQVTRGDRVLCEYGFDQLRFSITWKAWCFEDEAERRAWAQHTDDVQPGEALRRLTDELERRGRPGRRQSAQDLIRTLVSEFVRFPPLETD